METDNAEEIYANYELRSETEPVGEKGLAPKLLDQTEEDDRTSAGVDNGL